MTTLPSLVASSAAPAIHACTRAIDLAGAWTLIKHSDRSAIAATVPGCVHTDLLAAGLIPDPFWRDNESRIAWVHHEGWSYVREFTVDAGLMAHQQVWLRCDGLDTLATVLVNDREVLRADNMFRAWEADLKPVLRPGVNRIEVRFPPLLPYLKQLEQAHRPLISANVYHPDFLPKSYIRKMACSFGWDWGLMAPTAGIWRGIAIHASSGGRITSVRVQQQHEAGSVTLSLQVRSTGPGELHLTADGRTVVGTSLVISQPRLWWPNGLGEQHLYSVRLELVEAGRVVDAWEQQVGLRTLELIQQPDQWGESFQFRCNGVDLFAKGANWIPADIFPSRCTRQLYDRLIDAAADAHMNMIRVWGGGIYEDESFYDACDRRGVLVWQDFMYACSAYPTFIPEFLANCRIEAEEQIMRLHHRASLALWCGNNELEQGFIAEEWSDTTMGWADYAALFDRALPQAVRRLDGTTPYWPCSPHTNLGDRHKHWSDRCGDAHAWDVWGGSRDFEGQRLWTFRFMSEFGFQSYPEPRTVESFTEPADRNLTSRILDYHQRSSGRGNQGIYSVLLAYFRAPKGFNESLWCSQLTHALCIQYAAEHTRRMQPRTMGCLYWQLNDLWPAPTWSSIDVFGRWKALQYLAGRFFAPVLISGLEQPRDGTVVVHVSNHRRTAISATVRWRITDHLGAELQAGTAAAQVPAQANHPVVTVACQPQRDRFGAADVSGQEQRRGAAVLGGKRADPQTLLWLELVEDGAVISRNLVLWCRPKHVDLAADPGIVAEVVPQGIGSRITLRSRHPALWVRLELDQRDARFSDNWFHLDGRTSMEVTTDSDAATVRAHLRWQSLVDLG